VIKITKHIKSLVIISAFLSGSIFILSSKADTIPNINLTTISDVNQGNSYITFPTDIGNVEPLWFEANLIPNFQIRKNKNSRLMGVLTPQIIIRMYREYSYPVKTPSFMPQVTMYYKLCKNRKNSTAFVRLAHHSNGQNENFYSEENVINLNSGDFSTNYIELGLIRAFFNENLNATQFFKSSFKKILIEDVNELNGLYSQVRWKNSFSVFKIRQNEITKLKKKAGFSLKLDTEFMFGDIYSWSDKNIDRVNVGFTAFYTPKFFEDIGFFINFYHGQDYYNIYFNHQLNIIRFGIMTELLRF